MIALASHELCAGCAACRAACRRGAIVMKEDKDGFKYPVVDKHCCVECGMCVKSCPVLTPNDERSPIACYAARSLDEKLRRGSSSGGVFSELALPVLRQGGCVYGCVMEPGTFRVFHSKAENERQLSAMRKSKYVQSDLGDVFQDVHAEVTSGRRVLFSGTPCQVSGLVKFLGKSYENLLLVGVICHGVPSYKLMEHFIRCKQKKSAAKLVTFDFRSKSFGWRNFAIRCDDESGHAQYEEGGVTNSYMTLFNGNVAFRESCYRCLSRRGMSPADVLIGDFWGIERFHKDMDDEKGTSVILAYTDQGVNAIRQASLELKEVTFDEAIKFNRNVHASEIRPLLRSVIYPLLNFISFDFMARLYRMTGLSEWKEMMYGIYRHVRPILVWLGLKR